MNNRELEQLPTSNGSLPDSYSRRTAAAE